VNHGNRSWLRRTLPVALAGALALGLAACGRGPATEETGQAPDAVEGVEATGKAAGENLAAARKPVDDKTLAVRVRAALMESPALNATTIEVAASRGVVTLFGTTNTSTRRDLAGYIALRVDGVTGVRNRIAIISSS
jgi:osmotically-inducible protein OsmY